MYPLQYRWVKSKGAPGLAFETWDPSNQFPLETPTLLFVIRSEAEGSAVLRIFPGNVFRSILDGNAEAKLLGFDGILALCFCKQAGLFGHLLRFCGVS